MENNLVSTDELKNLYFKNENKFFSKVTKKQDFHFKSTTEILSNIARVGKFKKVKETYKLNLILKKILLKSHLNWVLYAYYKNKKLIIGTHSHIGQSELNMQKYSLIEYLKKIEEYSDIESVSIIRDEKSHQKNTQINSQIVLNAEKSYGIFDNYLQEEVLYAIVERIKQTIRDTKLRTF
jgi:hypothetical protein